MNPYQILLNGSLRLLSLRPRSRKEITDYLDKKTHDQELIDRVISKLTEMGLIDDVKFAAWLVESRSRSRPRGKRLLIQELKSKGIDPANYELPTIDEKTLASQALQKKHRLWAKLPARDYRLKASRYLAARGFSWSAIETAIRKGYNEPDVS